MADWTLTHNAVTRTLAEWGLTGCVISEPGTAVGMFTAQLPGDMTDDVAWAHKDPVVIRLGDAVKWRGTAKEPLRAGEGIDEHILCEFADPWWWLGQAAYTQSWWDAATLTAYAASRVALFAEISSGTGWSPRSIGAEIAAIIGHCDALHGGGLMQVGTLSGDGFAITPTAERMQNVTHEGALLRALQWVPDAVPSWDHTTDPPSLNITQRPVATVRTYSFADGRFVVGQQFRARPDKVVTGVRIVWTAVDTFGNPTAAVDAAGASSGSGVVETVIDLTGGGGGGGTGSAPSITPALQQEYAIVTEPIDRTSNAWWFKFADTGAVNAADITVLAGPGDGIDADPALPENNGSSSGFSRRWVSGGMPKDVASSHARMSRVKGYLRVKTTTTDPTDSSLNMELWEILKIIVNVPSTDLTAGSTLLLRDETISMGGGVGGATAYFVSGGIAAALLAAWSGLQYDGSFRITAEECIEEIRTGDVVNVTDGRTEWLTMLAQVKAMTRNLDTGTTEITLGAADHLSLDEFTGLLKVAGISPALDLDQQAKGETPSSAPEDTTIGTLVNPGSITTSVLRRMEKLRIYTPTWEYFKDLTDDL